MSVILLIETTTVNCSVALHQDGKIIRLREESAEHFVHAESLHVFVKSVIEESGFRMNDLDAIAVSQGPGSYTGLRIGISAAKGFCFALNKPLIAVDTLEALAENAQLSGVEADIIIPMIDARRMEVYCAVYDGKLNKLEGPTAVVIDESYFGKYGDQRLILTGDGSAKFQHLVSAQTTSLNRMPSATMLSNIAQRKFDSGLFEDVAYFDPFYLKDYIPGVAKKSVL